MAAIEQEFIPTKLRASTTAYSAHTFSQAGVSSRRHSRAHDSELDPEIGAANDGVGLGNVGDAGYPAHGHEHGNSSLDPNLKATTHTGTSRFRAPTHAASRRGTLRIIEHPYAGRVGAHQDHAVSVHDPDYAEIVKRTPDAAPYVTWREALLDYKGFGEVELWKAAVWEMWGTMMLVLVTGAVSIGLGRINSPFIYTSTIIPSLLGSLATAIILPLLIYAAAPVSGGHLNPLITISTFFAQISTLPRTLLYVLFQMLGGVLGGNLLRAGLGRRLNPSETGGCTITSPVSHGSAFILELVFSTTLLFLAFGTALDPRQSTVFGPALGPALVGVSFAICGFASGVLRGGYSGASLNPARCFGLMSASSFVSRFNTYHWIHWVADILAGVLNALVWALVPVFRRARS